MAATILASAILTTAANILSDAGATRWPAVEMMDYLNAACREIALDAPEANSKTLNINIAAGTKQVLPPDCLTLLRVTRNMGTGTTPGEVPRRTKLELLDLQRPAWHTDTATTTVKNWMYDSRLAKTVWVYPPQVGATVVEIMYAAAPAQVTAAANPISIDDQYANNILDYVLYRAYSKDTDIPGMLARSEAHWSAFRRSLDVGSGTVEQKAPAQ